MLIAAGANLETTNQNNETPLYVAVLLQDLPAIDLLLYARANRNVTNVFGVTLLQQVANSGNPQLIQRFQ